MLLYDHELRWVSWLCWIHKMQAFFPDKSRRHSKGHCKKKCMTRAKRSQGAYSMVFIHICSTLRISLTRYAKSCFKMRQMLRQVERNGVHGVQAWGGTRAEHKICCCGCCKCCNLCILWPLQKRGSSRGNASTGRCPTKGQGWWLALIVVFRV